MSLRTPSVSLNLPASVVQSGTTEAIALVSLPVNIPFDNTIVIITWELVIANAASTTGTTIKLRRGPLITSPQINVTQVLGATASVSARYAGTYADFPGSVAAQQYTLTFQMQGSVGNSTVFDGNLTLLCL